MGCTEPSVSPHGPSMGSGLHTLSFPDSSGWNEVTARCPGFPTDRGQTQAGAPVDEAGPQSRRATPGKARSAPSETGLVCFQVLFFLKLVHSVGI